MRDRQERFNGPIAWSDLPGTIQRVAVMYPKSLGQDVPGSERRVHAALQSLDDDWHVLHSVAWPGRRNGPKGDGEADFVLLHPRSGLVVLEVKGGSIRVERGQWLSHGSAGENPIKNPYQQATDSKHTLIRYLRGRNRSLPRISLAHAVAFPDLSSVPPLGLVASRENTMLRGDLNAAPSFIERLVAHQPSSVDLTPEHMESILQRLAPTAHVRPLLQDEIDDVTAKLLTLTNEQLRVLDGLQRNRQAIVYGGAGTGKTVLAMEKARRLAAAGFRTLLTCLNKPLADHLREALRGQGVRVLTLHRLCQLMIQRTDLAYHPARVHEAWWADLPDETIEYAARAVGDPYDAVVIDEGQDLSPQMFAALERLILRPDSVRYVFADNHQMIYRADWKPPFDGVEFDLTTNCRNTQPIATMVARLIGDPPITFGAPGRSPELITAQTPAEVSSAITRALHKVLVEGEISPRKVVMLVQDRKIFASLESSSWLRAGIRLHWDHGIEDGEGSPARDARVETISRFKGLEADVVIVVMNRMKTDQDRTLAYIGTSRACAHLVVIAPAEVHAFLAGTDT